MSSPSIGGVKVDIRGDYSKLKGDMESAQKVATESLKGFDLSQIGRALTAGVTLPLLALGAAALKTAADFDDAFDNIRAATGATGPVLENLSQSFRTVFADVPASTKQVSDAIADLNVRLGLTGKPLEEMSTQMLNLARVTGSEVGPLIQQTTRVFGDWGVATQDQAGTLDLLFKVTQSTGIGIGALSEKVVQFGAPLRQMGFSLETSAALLGKFEKEGVNSELVMGSLRIALTRMAREGIQDSSAALVALTEKIKQAGTSGEANALALETFGARAGPDMAAAIREGRFEIEGLIETLNASGETVNKAAADTLSLSERLKLLGNQARLALEPLGVALVGAIEKLLTAARPLIDVLTSMLHSFGALDPDIQMLIIGLAAAAAAIGPLISAVSGLAAVFAGGGGLAALLGAAGPLAIAFGVALAAWAIATAISEIQKLNAEMNRLNESLAKGGAANREQAQTIKVLESAIASHNKQIGVQRVAVDSTGKSVSEYIDALKTAVKENGLAADSFVETGKAANDSARHTAGAAQSAEALAEAVKKADAAYKNALRAYENGKISIEKLGAAQAALVRAQDAADPERIAKRHETAYFEMLDRYEDMATGIIAAAVQLKKADEDLAKSASDLSLDFGKAHQKMTEEAAKAVAIIVPLNKRLPEGLQEAIKKIGEVGKAYEQLGITAPKVIAATVEANRKAWETISEDAGAQSVSALEAWVKYESSRQDAARRSGQVIPDEQKKALDKAQAQLDQALGKQETRIGRFTKQVSLIINDMARDLSKGLIDMFKNIFFDSDGFNRKLREDSEKLRSELATRKDDLEQFRADTEEKISQLQAGYSDRLERETSDLRGSLAERVEDYEEFRREVTQKLETLRSTEAARLDEEVQELSGRLREKEGAYEEYLQEVGEKEAELRANAADHLADQLADLRDNLRDKVQAYEDFVQDANIKLGRIGGDLAENIEDAQRSSNRRMEDENTDFARDQQKLNADILKAEKKGDQEQVRNLKRTLEEREQDHRRMMRRLQEDIDEQVSDAKDRAREQTEDLSRNLAIRTREHLEYIAENQLAEEEARTKSAKTLAGQLGDLQQNVDKRTKELLRFREETAAAISEAAAKSAQRVAAAEAETLKDLAKNKSALDAFALSVEEKLKALSESYKTKLGDETTALNAEFGKKLSEYDTYKAGVEIKLKELEDAHKGPLDRIGDMFKGVFESATNAILRLASEEVIGALIGKLKEIFGLGNALGGIFGGGVPTGGTPGVPAGTPGVPGGGGIPTDAAAGLATSVTGLINVVTGVITAAASVISAIYDIRQEGTLNQIERNTAAGSIHLRHILEKANQFWPVLLDTHNLLSDIFVSILREIRDGLKTLFSISVNLTGEEERRLVASLITRVGTFDTLATDRLLDINGSLGRLVTATQDVRAGIVAAVDESKVAIAGGLSRIENKLPSTFEKIIGGGAGLLGLAGGLPAALGGFLAGLLTGGGKAEDRIEENTRYTAGALLGPAGVIQTLREFLPNLLHMNEFNYNVAAPWMAEVSNFLRDIKNALQLGTNPILSNIELALVGDGARDVHIHLDGAVFEKRADIDYMVEQISRNLR